MGDLGPVLIAICGFSLLCLGLIALAAFITGRSILVPIVTSLFNRDSPLDDGEDVYEPRQSRRRDLGAKRKGSFSAQTAGVDPFDAAVQRHRQKRGDDPPRPSTSLGGRPKTHSGSESPFDSPPNSGRTSKFRPLRGASGLRGERDPDEIHDYDDEIDDEESFF